MITNNPNIPSQVVKGMKFPQFMNTLGIIPTSYKDSMTYYECLAWLCKYLEETVIPTVNQNGEAVEELQGLYIQLNEYVTNYFDNLDVQNEINDKIESMVVSGELENILKPYINNKFNTLSDELNSRIDLQNSSIASIQQAEETNSSRITNLTTTPSDSSELTDIRVAFNGLINNNAGNSVRNQAKSLNDKIKDLAISKFNIVNAKNITEGKQPIGNIGSSTFYSFTDNSNCFYFNDLVEVKQNDVIFSSHGYLNYYIFNASGLLVEKLGDEYNIHKITNPNAKFMRIFVTALTDSYKNVRININAPITNMTEKDLYKLENEESLKLLALEHYNIYNKNEIVTGKQPIGQVGTSNLFSFTNSSNAFYYNRVIAVKENDVIYANRGYINYYIYNNEGLLVQNIGSSEKVHTITNPNAKFMRIFVTSLSSYYKDDLVVALNRPVTDITDFSKCYSPNLLVEEDNVISSQSKIEKPQIILPSKIYLKNNRYLNIFAQNIIKNVNLKNIFEYRLQNSGSYNLSNSAFSKEVIHIAPSNQITGEKTLELTTTDRNKFTRNFNIQSFSGHNGIALNIVALGDSMTQPGIWMKELIRLASLNGINLNSLGTVNASSSQAQGIKTEGRSGWSTNEYLNNSSFSGVTNSFWNSNSQSFDFSYYMNNYHSNKTCDILAICLGVNDIGRISMEQMITNYNSIIASAKLHNPNIKILINLPPIRSCADNVLQSELDLPKQSHIALINAFDNNENNNIFVVPTVCNINPYEDYTLQEVSLDGRDNCKYNFANENYIIHFNEKGHYHWADVFINYIEYLTLS